MPLVVLGMHRSGTSALTRVLGLMGCYIGDAGDFNPIEPDNPKGYWERRDVWALNEATLDALGASWCRVADLDLERLDPAEQAGFGRSAREIVARLEPHHPWVIKDPRLCLLLPVWRPSLDAAVCLLAHRGPLEVARSLQARNGFPLAVGTALWEHHVLASLRHSAGLPRLLVAHAELISAPHETVRRLQRELAGLGVEGLRVPEPAVLDEFIDPKLHRARGEPAEEVELLNPAQLRLARALQDGSALTWPAVPRTSDGALDLLRGYFELDRQHEDAIRASGRTRAELEQTHGELEQRRAELERVGHESEQRRDELGRVRHESERRRVELEQVRHESKQRREELEHQADRVREIEARLDEVGQHAETAQAELARTRGTVEALEAELHESRQAVESVQLRLEQAWHQSGELERELEGAGFARQGLEHQLVELRREIGEAVQRADQLQALIELVLGSRRWRFAHQAGELAGRLTWRPRQPTATEHARRLIGEYREWRVRASRLLGLPEK